MSELSKEQLETIWRVLYPDKDPYKHDTAGDTFWDGWNTLCKKCKGVMHKGDPKNANAILDKTELAKKPCPIPDKLTKSLAEVAEDIQEWFRKNADDGSWMDEMTTIWQATELVHGELRGSPIDEWLLYYATPLDKITAFCKIHETKEGGD